ncbi:MAG: pyridoxal phosphate-dependent aminotransferase [Labilithrix sp.]|nr:pyridoxal phosphate-dependent aminotransferase [Labilithrix sp.]MCW5810400.1 pyridoxal phosphate-dependent aminotransferase [Labilithrix sp.]
MFAATRYIDWAMKLYGKVPYDLASSGVPAASFQDLGVDAPNIDDMTAYQRFPAAIARHVDVPVADVVPALGTSHAIFLAYAALLSAGDAGDEVLVETPGYEPLTRAAEGLGARVRTFERRAEDGFRVVPERVAAAITPRTRAIVVTTLHNPTGVRVSDDEIRELAKIADARGAHVVVDEVYAPLEDLPEDGVFRRSARKLAPNVVAISSLTKCWGLGMHRVGWLLGPEPVVAAAKAASIATVGHLPLSHAAYGAAALGALGTLSRRAKSLVAGKRELAEAWASKLPNARWSAPAAGLFGMITLPGRGDLTARIEETARTAGVLVGAGAFFGAPESFRLSWATCDRERFAEGLRLLEPLCR